jgi:hypothetical protein
MSPDAAPAKARARADSPTRASSAARADLAARQRMLVEMLVRGGESGAEFDARQLDASQIDVAAKSLLRKRTRSVRKAWPGIAASLGDCFAARFAEFARDVPPPEFGGSLADGRRFGEWLAARGELSATARGEVRRFDAHYKVVDGQLVRRRFPRLRHWLLRSLSVFG